ncbi:phage holin, LLH family [Agrilactobacillus composti]|uniref:phage holin, LLH family n=1 Tax=Agrilactobacillus composti TaxID=398555 RepID=UPI0009DE433F
MFIALLKAKSKAEKRAGAKAGLDIAIEMANSLVVALGQSTLGTGADKKSEAVKQLLARLADRNITISQEHAADIVERAYAENATTIKAVYPGRDKAVTTGTQIDDASKVVGNIAPLEQGSVGEVIDDLKVATPIQPAVKEGGKNG